MANVSRALPTLYHSRLHLADQCRTIHVPKMDGEIKKCYPLLGNCSLSLAGLAGSGATMNRWQYTLQVPIMLLSANSAGCGLLRLYPEIETPYSFAQMRSICNLSCDVTIDPLFAKPLGQERFELEFSAIVCLYLSP